MTINDIRSFVSADGNDIVHQMVYNGFDYEALISCEDIAHATDIDRYDHKACLDFVRRDLAGRDSRIYAGLVKAEQFKKFRYRVAL